MISASMEPVRGMNHNVLLRWSVAFLLGCTTVLSQAGTLVGVVVSVQDGDTLTVLDTRKVQHRIRLSGIDAPDKGQAYSGRSKQVLADAAFRRDVEVVWHKHDRYDRVVGTVLLNGQDLNLAQVAAGLA